MNKVLKLGDRMKIVPIVRESPYSIRQVPELEGSGLRWGVFRHSTCVAAFFDRSEAEDFVAGR